MFRRNARESAFSSSWAAYKRVYRAPAPAHTKLLLCFSRLRSSKMFNTGSDVSKGECLAGVAHLTLGQAVQCITACVC
jgi:hypothetical protein